MQKVLGDVLVQRANSVKPRAFRAHETFVLPKTFHHVEYETQCNRVDMHPLISIDAFFVGIRRTCSHRANREPKVQTKLPVARSVGKAHKP